METALAPEFLTALNEQLLQWPEEFTVHPKLRKQLERRRTALGPEGGIDWAHAEALALASLLTEAVPIRLTGQDTERGTFSQRHLVLHDVNTGTSWTPLQRLPGALAPLELHNSPLSELATLGFEYGYSAAAPEALVLWEAQFGDFINGAQVIIDQFLASGLSKWGLTTRLTLLLPHGYEGQGPEHSSARLERFLQLAAEGNIRVANPTTPAQYFHLLRRQARRTRQRPLVIMTPKSLLRLPQASSRLEDLATGAWRPVLDDPTAEQSGRTHTRLVLCSGKVYYDLVAEAEKMGADRPAIVRLEQLYSFPWPESRELLSRYGRLEELVWVQEEPRNMGAWSYVEPKLREIGGSAGCRSPTSAGRSGRVPLKAIRLRISPSSSASCGRRSAWDGGSGWRCRTPWSRRERARTENQRGRPGPPSSSPCFSVPRQERSLRCLASQLPERLRKVLPVVKQEYPPRALLHQERHQRRVRLGRVAVAAGEDQIVRAVVRRLSPAGTDMVQRDDLGWGLGAAIGAHRTVLGEKPITVRLHGATRGAAKTGNRDCGMSA